MNRKSKRREHASSPRAGATPTSEPAASRPRDRSSAAAKRNMITAVLVGGLALGAWFLGAQATKPNATGDSITKAFSQAAPCASATIVIAPPAGSDPAQVAETLFAALASAPGMNSATYNVKTSALEAGFCESQGSEATVREALAPTGLVAESAQ